MGIKLSKSSKTNKTSKSKLNITSFSSIKIPSQYKMLKLCSFNVNLRNSANNDAKINNIIRYLNDNYKDKQFDIICLQGIHDYASACNLIKAIRQYEITIGCEFFYAPQLNTYEEDIPDDNKFGTMLRKPKQKRNSMNKNNTKNIIISKYPILDIIYAELDDSTRFDDIIGVQTVIGANVLIENTVISIYNTELCKNIKTAGIINTLVRKTELTELFKIIEQNKLILKNEKYKEYIINDIHFLVGTLNINDIDDKIEDQLNEEFIYLVENYHCIDIFRYKNGENKGYTNNNNERSDYIMMQLTNDLYDGLTDNNIHNIQTDEELFKLIHKRYKVHFIDITVRNISDKLSHTSFPIELVFILNLNNSK